MTEEVLLTVALVLSIKVLVLTVLTIKYMRKAEAAARSAEANAALAMARSRDAVAAARGEHVLGDIRQDGVRVRVGHQHADGETRFQDSDGRWWVQEL